MERYVSYIINLNAPFGILKCRTLKQLDEAFRKICYNDYQVHSIVGIYPDELYNIVYYFDYGIYDKLVSGWDVQQFIDHVNDEGGQVEWIIRARAKRRTYAHI